MRRPEILCIDDDDQSLRVRKILLETFDFHVTTAINGREGLRLFRSRNVDAVVVDYQMPDMDGGEVARAVKDLRPEVPVVVLSALPWLPQDAPRECINAFITKGDPTTKLVQQIERLIETAPRPTEGQSAKDKMRAVGMIGAISGMMAEKVLDILGKPKAPRPSAKLPRVARAQ